MLIIAIVLGYLFYHRNCKVFEKSTQEAIKQFKDDRHDYGNDDLINVIGIKRSSREELNDNNIHTTTKVWYPNKSVV